MSDTCGWCRLTRIRGAARQRNIDRANNRCEYCLIPQTFNILDYQVYHIRPLYHEGSDEPENLAWSCTRCNRRKEAQISAYDPETGVLTPLLNPRTPQWHDHFQLTMGRITPTTAVGRVSEFVLRFNSEYQLTCAQCL